MNKEIQSLPEKKSSDVPNKQNNQTNLLKQKEEKPKNDFSSLKQILIMQELENFKEKKAENTEKPEKTVRFEGVKDEQLNGEASSEESFEDEEDYLENQRLHIKLGSDAKFSESKSAKKLKKQSKQKAKAENKDASNNQNELPMIEQLIQEKYKSRKQQEENEKNPDLEFIEGEKFKQQLILEELERKRNNDKQKDLEEMKRLQEKFKNEIEENKRKKKEKKKKELEEQAILVLEQK